MKKMMILAMLTTIVVSAKAMTYSEARDEALFLTDKMAYELVLSDSQYEDVYKVNLDYLMAITSGSNLYGAYWTHRNTELRYILSAYQYDKYLSINYFYRPVDWYNNTFNFVVYRTYTDRHRYYRPRPAAYHAYKGPSVKGQINWHSNAPKDHHVATAPNHHTGTISNYHHSGTTSNNHSGSTSNHHSGSTSNHHSGTTSNNHSGSMKPSTDNKPSTSHGSTTFGSGSSNRNGGSFGNATAKAPSNSSTSKGTFGGRR